jgi:hypothetical protein
MQVGTDEAPSSVGLFDVLFDWIDAEHVLCGVHKLKIACKIWKTSWTLTWENTRR